MENLNNLVLVTLFVVFALGTSLTIFVIFPWFRKNMREQELLDYYRSTYLRFEHEGQEFASIDGGKHWQEISEDENGKLVFGKEVTNDPDFAKLRPLLNLSDLAWFDFENPDDYPIDYQIGSTIFRDYNSYKLITLNNGKDWYAVAHIEAEKEEVKSGQIITGHAEDVYPGLVAHNAGWDNLIKHVEENGPIDLSDPQHTKLLTNAGFSVEKKATE